MLTQKLYGLYVITDENLIPEDRFENGVTQALKGGARIIQYRNKTSSYELKTSQALRLVELCHSYGALCFINDDPVLAQSVGADGVHVGEDDVRIEEIKATYPNLLVGVSCYGDSKRAVMMEKKGADYVAFGACFPSLTKPHAPTLSMDVISEAKKNLSIPVCCIGGITLDNAPSLIERGTDMVAVVGDIWKASNIELQANGYSKIFGQER